ncbi:MAG TPA: GyrI-like domain-containing protein [Actinomycetota bacterium]
MADRGATMGTGAKLDMKKELRFLYAPPTHPVFVEVPALRYLAVDGAIPEGTAGPAADPEFGRAIGALYSVSYTLKFAMKPSGRDFVVMPLEGLFWTDGTEKLAPGGFGAMRWTLMMLMPPWITDDDVAQAVSTLVDRGRLSGPSALRLVTLEEERAAQILHVGPYADESPTIEKLHAFIEEHGLEPRSKHHEIYLSDPNRTAPERLKTVIRQPVRPRRA